MLVGEGSAVGADGNETPRPMGRRLQTVNVDTTVCVEAGTV